MEPKKARRLSHGTNKLLSFVQILDSYGVNLLEFVLFGHVNQRPSVEDS